ncbi:MAG: transketolase family protein [Candidatus Omnitrophica bacterium]|nr:transketolase family protein [Candidatus Omnitrophota bacterium]
MEKRLGKATRDAYGEVIVEMGRENPQIVVLDADLSKSTKTAKFGETFPERFFNVGIMEANLVGVASGLAACGKIPYISSFATFLISKGYDQLRMGVSYSELGVKVVASHGGISIGEDGASQMSIEDVALTASLPGMTVIIPADEFSARALIRQTAEIPGAVYVRTGRPKTPIIYDASSKFEIGKANRLRSGKDLTIVANGLLVFEALAAAEELEKKGIQAGVIDMHTIKPLDEAMLLEEARKTGRIVVAEEHQIWGGLGSAVARFLSENCPCRMEFVAIQDTYAESGLPDEVMEKYGLTAPAVVKAAERLLKKS